MEKQQEYQLCYEKSSVYNADGKWHDKTIIAEDEHEAMKRAILELDSAEMMSASTYITDAHLITGDNRKFPVPKHCKRQDDIDTIIFDIGDVLAKGGHRTMLKGLGQKYAEREYHAWQDYKVGKCTEQQYWQKLFEGTPLQGAEDGVAKFARELFKNCPIGDAYKFLQPLKDKKYKLAVLSNHSTEWASIVVEKLELRKFCDPILISSDIQLEKPDPAIYSYTLRAVDREKAPFKCYFIDDKLENIVEARRAGMHAFHFKNKDSVTADILLEAELKLYGLL